MEHKGQGFEARLIRYQGEKLDKMALGKEGEAEAFLVALQARRAPG